MFKLFNRKMKMEKILKLTGETSCLLLTSIGNKMKLTIQDLEYDNELRGYNESSIILEDGDVDDLINGLTEIWV